MLEKTVPHHTKTERENGSPLVVMIPAFKGLPETLPPDISSIAPRAVIVPVLNGLPQAELDSIAGRYQSAACKPLVTEARGLGETLIAGYQWVAQEYSKAVVVRLDTAEHPPGYIPRLEQLAAETRGMVIGDLTFGPENLLEGTPDWKAHKRVWPHLYRLNTMGRLCLSCAHGYQAFGPGIIGRVLPDACRIMAQAGNPNWGFDAAMALSALGNNVPVKIEPIPAGGLRNRGIEKVMAQFLAHKALCRAARAYFKWPYMPLDEKDTANKTNS